MKTIVLIFTQLLLLVGTLNAQVEKEFTPIKYLEVSNKLQKVGFVEGDRVRVQTISGGKITGGLRFKNNETILVRDKEIPLKHLMKIKRQPLFYTILVTGVMVYFATGFLLTSLFIALLFPNSGLSIVLAIFAIPPAYGIVKNPNVFKGYKRGVWNYDIKPDVLE